MLAICLLGGIKAERSNEDSGENSSEGLLSKIFRTIFPKLPPLPEKVKEAAYSKMPPKKPYYYPSYGNYDAARADAAGLLGLLGSVIGPDAEKENPITQKPSVVRVTVTVPPSELFFKPKLYRKRRQINPLASLPLLLPPNPLLPQGINQLQNAPYHQQPTYYPPSMQYSTPSPYTQQYNPPSYNQTYIQSNANQYYTTKKPYYNNYVYASPKPRPAPPVVINVPLPTTTTTTIKPYTVKYSYYGYKPSKPYYKPAYNKPY